MFSEEKIKGAKQVKYTELGELLKEYSRHAEEIVNKEKEYLCYKFMIETGLPPSKLEICSKITDNGEYKVWVQEKEKI